MRSLFTWLVKIVLFIGIFTFSLAILYVAIAYFSPDFSTGFLKGKQVYFDNYLFPIALISHGISASIAVIFLSVLVLFRMERKYLFLHRLIGKWTLILIVFIAIPSAFVLSLFADGGKLGKISFLLLTCVTFYAVINAWQAIKRKKVTAHKIWMQFLLLLFSSAFVLRILIVLFSSLQMHSEGFYPIESLLSWVPGSVVFWLFYWRKVKVA